MATNDLTFYLNVLNGNQPTEEYFCHYLLSFKLFVNFSCSKISIINVVKVL